MNVVLQIQMLGIPQRRRRSRFLHDNPTIHSTIWRLTATYADVRGSASFA